MMILGGLIGKNGGIGIGLDGFIGAVGRIEALDAAVGMPDAEDTNGVE